MKNQDKQAKGMHLRLMILYVALNLFEKYDFNKQKSIKNMCKMFLRTYWRTPKLTSKNEVSNFFNHRYGWMSKNV